MKRIPMEDLVDFGTEYLVRLGTPRENAAYVAKIIVEAEAFRLSTHGLVQFAAIGRSVGETLDPKSNPTVVMDQGPSALVEGRDCIGILCVRTAKEISARKAREHGIGISAVRNTNWIGALGIHLVSLAREGLLAQIYAQSAACKDCAPFGGMDPRFSTNPIAIGIPAEPDPVIGDFSTASMSLSAAMSMAAEGKKAGTQRFLDKEGRPTDDPNVLKDAGTLMFTGCDTDGHKGYVLSLWIESLVAMAGGSANNPQKPNRQSFVLIALDPEQFAGRAYFQQETARFLAHVKSSRVRPGFERIRLPGEDGFRRLRDCRKNGLPLDEAKAGILESLAKESGIACPV